MAVIDINKNFLYNLAGAAFGRLTVRYLYCDIGTFVYKKNIELQQLTVSKMSPFVNHRRHMPVCIWRSDRFLIVAGISNLFIYSAPSPHRSPESIIILGNVWLQFIGVGSHGWPPMSTARAQIKWIKFVSVIHFNWKIIYFCCSSKWLHFFL